MPHLDEGTIHAWLDGALSEADARAAESHVTGCATCSAAVAEARGLIAASSRILSALDEPVGASAAPSTRSLPPREHETLVRRRRVSIGWMRAAAVLVVAAGSLTVARVVGRSTTAFDARREMAAPESSPAGAATATAAPMADRATDVPAPATASRRAGEETRAAAAAVPMAKRAAAQESSRRVADAAADAANFSGKLAAAPTPMANRAARKLAMSTAEDAALIGCYELRSAEDGSLPPGVPRRFALDAEPVASVGDVARLRARGLGATSASQPQGWWSVAGDSVTVAWPAASGDSVQLGAHAVASGLRATVLRPAGEPAGAAAPGPIEFERLRCEDRPR